MKKKIILLIPLISVIALTGCEIFDTIASNLYPDLETYFKKNNFTDSETADDFNNIMRGHVYFWSKEIQTYTNSDNSDIVYNSPRGDHITHYERNNQITIYSRYAERITLMYGEDQNMPIRYVAESGETLRIDSEGAAWYLGDDNVYHQADVEQAKLLQVQKEENGYLLVTQNNFMLFVSKDYTEFYINTENTTEFTNYEGKIVVPESDLLTSSLSKCETKEKLYIPVPQGYQSHIYHKDYLDKDDGTWEAYDVIFPLMKAVDYVDFLKEQGFEIYRGEYHEMFALDGENDGEWVVYDKNHEFNIHLQYLNPIAVLTNSEPSYGVELHVQRAEMTFSYYGLTVNEQTDWKDSEKEFMQKTFGRELPFINLGRHYRVSEKKRKNGEHPLESALDMDVECYWITDNFYKDVITDKYGEMLETAGFTKYIPPVTKQSEYSEKRAWKYSEDVKYYECYIDDEHDLAVKFLFDDIYGNTIKVFKKFELVPWNSALDEADKK